MTHYDIIGDVHGHAEELKELLSMLGYRQCGYGFRHDKRQVIFVGDFIDRGPEIAKVIEIARATVEDGYGHAVMGNHEFNAIAFHTRKPGSHGFFRERSVKNQDQHQETLNQLSSLQMQDALAWFKTLPVALELEGLRVVHAAWQPNDIGVIETSLATLGRFTTDFLKIACSQGTQLHQAIENVLKGPEMRLPNGKSFQDKDGHVRFDVRVRWYADPWADREPEKMKFREYAFGETDHLPDDLVPENPAGRIVPYSAVDPFVFFGHYWLQGKPDRLAPNVACVDYSVAKNGKLCAYQWSPGETTLCKD